jgi:O-antigen ligase
MAQTYQRRTKIGLVIEHYLTQSVSSKLADVFIITSKVSFGIAIILTPFRYRIDLLARPSPPVYQDFTDLLVYTPDVFIVIMLLFWLASLAVRSKRIQFKPWLISIPLLALTFVSIVSAFFSVDKIYSLYQSVRLVIFFGFFLFVINEINSISQIVIPVSLGIFFQAVVAITQSLEQSSLGLTFLQELSLDPKVSGVSIVTVGNIRFLRAYGLTDHPNILGGCLAFGLVIIAAWFLSTREENHLLAGSIFILGSISLFLTFSRAAWVGFFAALLLVTIWLLKNRRSQELRKWFSLMIAGLIVILPFIWQYLPLLSVRLGLNHSFTQVSTEVQSIDQRLTLIALANQIFASHPIIGVGVSAFPSALHQIQPFLPFDYQPPHFVLLDVAAETGLFGSLFYILLIGMPWLLMWARRKHINFSIELVGASAALLAITVVSVFDYYPWMLEAGRIWLWLLTGLWGATYVISVKQKKEDHG